MPVVGQASIVAALPAGGSTGQALVKTTAADFALGWAATTVGMAGGGPVYTSGLWFDNRYVGDSSGVTGTLAANTCVYAPVWLNRAVTINGLAVLASSPNSTSCQLGVFSYAASKPASLLASVTVALTNTVVARTVTIGNTSLPAGWSVLALCNPSSTDAVTFNRASRGYISPIGQNGNSGPLVNYALGWRASTGTLASNPTVTPSDPLPTIYFKIA